MTMIIGHRGGRNLWPENSLSGFLKTRALALDGVEFDVHLTKAGELVVIHDATLDRTSLGTGPVADLPLGAHQTTLLKGTVEGIPLLKDVLEIFAQTTGELHIELKDDVNGVPYPGLVDAVYAEVERYGLLERSFLTSFSLSVLEELRAKYPKARTLNSMHGPNIEREGLIPALEKRLALADVIAIQNDVLREHWDTITSIVPLSLLGGWVPNTEEDLRYWLTKGLRQITTDEPIRALGVSEDRPTPANN
ncbi:glycerophosphodiester phosphodiesterase family protein [Devosia sp. MC1541]|uniref:glycerophosphodiester phosphodiesterase family protein n=1 Tax=Devosia sp. MC1541 TaxID=2725264 RepID=UPI00145D8161|nr:glycerophosphodiester phosphodiesterase family protein [Devosia sp. MC1541]